MRLEWINESGRQPVLHYGKKNGVNLPTTLDDTALDVFGPFSNREVSTATGNMIETRDDFRLEMVAPGMNEEDFTLELQGDRLRISCEHDDSREGMRYDYTYRSLARNFLLPKNADTERIRAKYENGILDIILPKRQESNAKIFK